MVHVVATWNGRKAHALRIALRMTNEAFAHHLGLAPRAIAKWEAQPDIVPAMTTQQVLDVALAQASDEVKARFSLLLAEVEQREPEPTRGFEHPSQRATSTLAAVMTSSRRQATRETLDYLQRTLRDHYTADNLLGPRVLLPVISAHLEAIEQLRHDASGRMLDELLRTGAGYAEFAGWLCHDTGDLAGAAAWCNRALEWAQAAGDDRMAAFVMMRRAAQSISAREGAYAVRLASAAQRYRSPETTRVRAIAALTEAHGHAITGDAGEADRALDAAASLVEGANGMILDGDPTDGRYCELGLYLNISRAKCELELGRAAQAVEAFRLVLDTLPPDYHRDRGQYLARLAQAYILAGQPEEACAAAEESLAIAIATGSTRTIADLRRAASHGLARWKDLPAVDKLRDLLAAVERPNGGA